jgi:hypothetical protein
MLDRAAKNTAIKAFGLGHSAHVEQKMVEAEDFERRRGHRHANRLAAV